MEAHQAAVLNLRFVEDCDTAIQAILSFLFEEVTVLHNIAANLGAQRCNLPQKYNISTSYVMCHE